MGWSSPTRISSPSLRYFYVLWVLHFQFSGQKAEALFIMLCHALPMAKRWERREKERQRGREKERRKEEPSRHKICPFLLGHPLIREEISSPSEFQAPVGSSGLRCEGMDDKNLMMGCGQYFYLTRSVGRCLSCSSSQNERVCPEALCLLRVHSRLQLCLIQAGGYWREKKRFDDTSNYVIFLQFIMFPLESSKN